MIDRHHGKMNSKEFLSHFNQVCSITCLCKWNLFTYLFYFRIFYCATGKKVTLNFGNCMHAMYWMYYVSYVFLQINVVKGRKLCLLWPWRMVCKTLDRCGKYWLQTANYQREKGPSTNEGFFKMCTVFPRLDAWASISRWCFACLASKRSRSVNLNVEFCRCLERITSTPPSVKMSRGI